MIRCSAVVVAIVALLLARVAPRASAFRPMLLPLPPHPATTPLTSPAAAPRLGRGVGVGVGVATGGLRLMPEIHAAGCDDHQLLMQIQTMQQQIIPIMETTTPSPSSPAYYYASALLSAEGGGGGGGDVVVGESWRQYVPLGVSVVVIIDILLGSPLANMALAPMKRASEKGATGGGGDGEDGERGSLFSAFGGGGDGVDGGSRGKERVDSLAIARAALDKAEGTLELRRFLDENKSNEQKYEDVRKKIDRQMEELDD